MNRQPRNTAVVLCDPDEPAGPGHSALRVGYGPDAPDAFHGLEELMRHRDPSSIRVLALHTRHQPQGALLAVLSRWGVEFPWIQRVAVLDAPPSLPVATQLVRSGFWLLHPDEAGRRPTNLNQALEILADHLPWIDAPGQGPGEPSTQRRAP